MANMLAGLGKDLQKKYAKTNKTIVRDPNAIKELQVFSSGCLTIDAVSGIGGLVPRGHVVEVVGANTSGKTTITTQACVDAQRQGENIVYIDSEGVFDESYAKKLGLDVDADSFLLIRPQDGEEVHEILDFLSEKLHAVHDKYKKPSDIPKEDTVALVVVDSVAMTRPRAEFEGNKQIGQHATLWSKLAYKIKNMVMKYNIGVVLINQVRYAPSIGGGYSAPGVLDSAQMNEGSENTTGGEALKFLYSIRWQFKGFSKILGSQKNPITGEINENARIGNMSHVMTIKNKLATPMVKSQFAIEYGKGTVEHHVLTEIMKKKGFITNKGTWKMYECLDKSLQPNMDHVDYPGHLYGRAKFDPWYLSPEIQEDVKNRFKLILKENSEDALEEATDSDLEEGLEFEIEEESTSEESSSSESQEDELEDASEEEIKV